MDGIAVAVRMLNGTCPGWIPPSSSTFRRTVGLSYSWNCLFAVGSNPAVYLRRTDGSQAVRLGYCRRPSLSPDGRLVACVESEPQRSALLLLPTGAGDERRITGDGMQYERVQWMPDGRRVLFTGRRNNGLVTDVRATGWWWSGNACPSRGHRRWRGFAGFTACRWCSRWKVRTLSARRWKVIFHRTHTSWGNRAALVYRWPISLYGCSKPCRI